MEGDLLLRGFLLLQEGREVLQVVRGDLGEEAPIFQAEPGELASLVMAETAAALVQEELVGLLLLMEKLERQGEERLRFCP